MDRGHREGLIGLREGRGDVGASKPRPSSAGVSARMSRLSTTDTQVELAVRRALHRLGMRYRVHGPVPGMRRRSMDIAFMRAKVAVFVDGCFWHGCPLHGSIPHSNQQWWTEKIEKNVHRDAATAAHLIELGWRVFRFWEHEDPNEVAQVVNESVLALRPGGIEE
jgi:DNA mismatch endonuclease (patch repair protein)